MADHHQVTVALAHPGTPSECWRAECQLPGCGWQHGSAHEDTATAVGMAHTALPWPARSAGLRPRMVDAELAAACRRRAAVLLLMASQLDPR